MGSVALVLVFEIVTFKEVLDWRKKVKKSSVSEGKSRTAHYLL